MVSKLVTIVNETGIHARPATELSKFCSGFNEKITFICDGNGVDPKSIILLLAAGIKKGNEIEV
ncbi:MAG: HPr family phosphocarrier protein, partial [Lachnospiraceae bacterium]|nr:HPr family phosphocarrier protein [Lachnospiraceae bacterium]